MVAAEIEPGVQATRAAKFWDDFYEPTASSSSTSPAEDNTEWLVEPSILVPALLKVLQKSPAEVEQRGFTVVELGCGDSSLSQCIYDALADRGNVSVLGVDISSTAVAKARVAGCSCGTRPGLSFECADATDLRELLEDGVVDLVVDKGMSDTLQFRARTKESTALRLRFFAEVFRVLRTGGCYALVTPKRRARYVRTVPWESIEQECLTEGCDADSRPLSMFVAKRSNADDAHIFLHACRKGLSSSSASAGSEKSARIERQEDAACISCGLGRYPRYRSEAAWAKHLLWCSQSDGLSAVQSRSTPVVTVA